MTLLIEYIMLILSSYNILDIAAKYLIGHHGAMVAVQPFVVDQKLRLFFRDQIGAIGPTVAFSKSSLPPHTAAANSLSR